MNLLEIFGNSFLVGLSGAMMPGPLLVVALARTPAFGPRTGVMVTIGHGIVELATVALLAFGLAALVGEEPMIARVVAVVGGVMLLLMTTMMFLEVRAGIKSPESTAAKNTENVGSLKLIREGMLATISNPYWFVWWGTIGSALVVISLQAGKLGPPVFYVGHILSDLAWYSLITILLWQGKNLLAGRRYHILIGACAVFLLWLGGWFIYSGVTGAITLN
jgi:threonine/homoserine/homoserine lactone efflux protein